MAETAQYRRYRAPQEDGQVLVDPPRASLAAVVARNRRHAGTLDYDLQGRSLRKLAATARRSLVERAVDYTTQYRELGDASAAIARHANAPLVLSGHQPQLYHPGVWYKNFVLGQLAGEVDGVAIHLLIDSDSCRTATIRVPTGSVDLPRVESLPFDIPAAAMPYEERAVCDEALFDSFPNRVAAMLRPFIAAPVVNELWPLIRKRTSGETNLGRRIAQGRHSLEAAWGNETLELPQSAVCGLREFAWFLAHVLAHLPRFRAAYNEALDSYRRAHGLRNRAHPVPDLAHEDGWLEAPFWIWSTDDPRRQPLFVRQRGGELLISDRQQRSFALSLTEDGDAAIAVEQFEDLAARGIKIRTRALTTTLFARLLLSDIFLHGIGGAKYDQVTNQIAEQFFGFALPEFATVSATLRLPIDHPRSNAEQLLSTRQQLRELNYHPERSLSGDGAATVQTSANAASILADKRRWLATPVTPNNARARHLGIHAANAALQSFVQPRRDQLRRQLNTVVEALHAKAILESRDYSFVLYPGEDLRRLLLDGAAAGE
ncbi:MAG TPA: hypothetical protein VGM76_03265 [Lacipirellulaceae bacterium]